MRRARLAAIAAVALLGCAPMSACLHLGGPPAATAALTPAKTLYLAEAAFAGVSTALEAAADSGRLKGPAAAKARAAYGLAHEALVAARAAETAGDAGTLAERTAAAIAAIATVQQLVATGGGFGAGRF